MRMNMIFFYYFFLFFIFFYEYDDHSTLILRVVTVGRGFAETILWHHFMHHNKSYLVICHILSSYLVISICYTLSSYLVLCHILSSYYVISICFILSSVFVTFCHHIWSFVTSRHHIMSSVFVTCCYQYLLHFVIIFGPLSHLDIILCHQYLLHFVTNVCHHILPSESILSSVFITFAISIFTVVFHRYPWQCFSQWYFTDSWQIWRFECLCRSGFLQTCHIIL